MQKATRFEASFWTFDVNGYAMQDLRTAFVWGAWHRSTSACVPLAHARFFRQRNHPSILTLTNHSQRPLL